MSKTARVKASTAKPAKVGRATTAPTKKTSAKLTTPMLSSKTFVLEQRQPSLPPGPPLSPAYFVTPPAGRSPDDTSGLPTRALKPYETLTGITSERPEVILLSELLPFHTAEGLTDAARFFDVQAQVRELRVNNATTLLEQLTAGDPERATEIKQQFTNTVGDIRELSNFFIDLMARIEGQKARMDLRNRAHVVEASSTVSKLDIFGGGFLSPSSKAAAKKQVSSTQDYSLSDVLVGFGFNESAVNSDFSSTKVWMQLLYEFKQLLTTHSTKLVDFDVAHYADDRSATTMTYSRARTFISPTLVMPSLDEIVKLDASRVTEATETILTGFNALYGHSPARTREQRIAALVNMISKEFRYSSGLFKPETSAALRQKYGYAAVSSGNQSMFDNVVGQFGGDVSDVPVDGASSLASLAHLVDGSTGVLTFESRYVTTQNGVVTPGSAYYVDSVLEPGNNSTLSFNTTRLQSLVERFDEASNSFNSVVNLFNIFSFENGVPGLEYVASGPALFDSILAGFVDRGTGVPFAQLTNDPMVGLFAEAAYNQLTKSYLFSLVIANLPGSTNASNTQLTDALLKATVDSVVWSKPAPQYVNITPDVVTVSVSDVQHAVRNKTSAALNVVTTTLSTLLSAFRDNDLCVVDGKLRYGGYGDTMLAMVLFDALCDVVGSFCGHRIVAKSVDSIHVQRRIVSTTMVATDIRSRLQREVDNTRKCVYTIANTLRRVRDGAQGLVNFFGMPGTIARVASMAKIVDDEHLFRTVMSPQQLMMLGSNVADVHSRLQLENGNVYSSDKDADFTRSDVLTLLDDGVVSQRVRDAVVGFLRDPQYTTGAAHNKRILSVGVPVGFSERLKERSSAGTGGRSPFEDKQLDIVNVCVYKVDLQNEEIVFKPKKFLFEMSRFPAKDVSLMPVFRDMEQFIDEFPTRDYTQRFETQGTSSDTQFLNRADKVRAFDDNSYDFIPYASRRKIIRNHVVSFLMEVYVRLMTGVSVAEHSFPLRDETAPASGQFASMLSSLNLKDVVNRPDVKHATRTGVFFSNTVVRPETSVREEVRVSVTAPTSTAISRGKVGPAAAAGSSPPRAARSAVANAVQSVAKSVDIARGKVFGAVVPKATETTKYVVRTTPELAMKNTNITLVPEKAVPVLLQQQATIEEFSKMVTMFSDGLTVSKMLLSPKKFDRVFNVVFDSDTFEVDIAKTRERQPGRDALQRLLTTGDLIQVTSSRVVGREKTRADISLEKFFVVVETVDRDEFETTEGDGTSSFFVTASPVSDVQEPDDNEEEPEA